MHELAPLIFAAVKFSYLGFFVYFSSVGYVVPIPEEVVLAVIGFLAGIHKLNIYLALLACTSGVILGDNIFFFLASARNKYVMYFLNRLPAVKLKRYHDFMEQNLMLALIGLRFLMGVRFLGPVLAGSAGVPWRRFFWRDFLAVTLYVSGFLCLGFVFADEIQWLVMEIEWFRKILFGLLIFGLGGWLVSRFWFKIKK